MGKLSNIHNTIIKINYAINCVSLAIPCGRGTNYCYNITQVLVPLGFTKNTPCKTLKVFGITNAFPPVENIFPTLGLTK